MLKQIVSGACEATPVANLLQRPLADADRAREHNEYLGAEGALAALASAAPLLAKESVSANADVEAYVRSINEAAGASSYVDNLDQVYEAVWAPAQDAGIQQGDAIWGNIVAGGSTSADPVADALTAFLRGTGHMTAVPVSLDAEAKRKVRDRAGIMARHLFAEQGEAAIERQVANIMSAFNISAGDVDRGFEQAFEEAYRQDQGVIVLPTESHPGGAGVALAPTRPDGVAWADQFQEELSPEKWGEQFASLQSQGQLEDDTAIKRASADLVGRVQASGDEKLKATEFMKFMQGISDGQLRIDGNQVVAQTTNGWTTLSAPLDDTEALAAEFADLKMLPQQHEDALGAGPSTAYVFQANNPWFNRQDAFDEGTRHYREGNLGEAILALEAAVQMDQSNIAAWRLLGAAHTERDEDVKALGALRRAVDIDPKDLDSLLALGVCYTNELETDKAVYYLKRWVQENATYSHLANMQSDLLGEGLAWLTSVFCEAAKENPNDARIFTVLGVLYNLSREFDNAAECFEISTKLNPDDFSSWNKLGATLANSYQNDAAMQAYSEALSRRPSYLRALVNLAICFSNQGRYSDSAEKYLQALRVHPEAEHIWSNLSISLACMGKPELSARADARDPGLLSSPVDSLLATP